MTTSRIVPLLLTAALVVASAGCGSSGNDQGARPAEGSWSYVDGSGRETALPELPDRIVMHASAAAALIPMGIRPVGIYADRAVKEDLALKQLDLSGVEVVGEEWGVINLEAVAGLRPDLILAEWWPLEQAYSGLEDGTPDGNKRLRDIAPVAGVAQGPSTHRMIEDYAELAASLGADPAAIAAARSRFDQALEQFKAALAAKPELTVLALSPAPEGVYVAVPEHAAELSDFMNWGMRLVVPDSPDEGFEYWETLSWENAGKYQADLLIIDERGYPANLDQAQGQPTWSFLKAAAADAVGVWPAFWVRNYDDYADALDRLTAAVNDAAENLV